MYIKMKNITLSVIAVLVTFAVTGKDIYSQNVASVAVSKPLINNCNNDNTRFTFSINIGEVKTTDSLFGFDFVIKYDANKIRILNALTGNTLSQGFEETGFSFAYEGNKIKGYATTMKFNIVPPSGNLPLIAFFAEWIGQNKCNDSSTIEIINLEFTEEFKKEIKQFQSGTIYSIFKPNEDKIVVLKPKYSNIQLKKNQNTFINSYLLELPENSKTDNIKIIFKETNPAKIKNVILKDITTQFELIKQNEINLRLGNNSYSTEFDIEFEYIENSIKNTVEIEKIEYSDCSCISGYQANYFTIEQDTTTPNSIANATVYKIINNQLQINGNEIQNIKLVDMLGQTLYEANINDHTNIDLSNLSANLMFLIISSNNKVEIKKIYKCY